MKDRIIQENLNRYCVWSHCTNSCSNTTNNHKNNYTAIQKIKTHCGVFVNAPVVESTCMAVAADDWAAAAAAVGTEDEATAAALRFNGKSCSTLTYVSGRMVLSCMVWNEPGHNHDDRNAQSRKRRK
jgi:hypothetical protein